VLQFHCVFPQGRGDCVPYGEEACFGLRIRRIEPRPVHTKSFRGEWSLFRRVRDVGSIGRKRRESMRLPGQSAPKKQDSLARVRPASASGGVRARKGKGRVGKTRRAGTRHRQAWNPYLGSGGQTPSIDAGSRGIERIRTDSTLHSRMHGCTELTSVCGSGSRTADAPSSARSAASY